MYPVCRYRVPKIIAMVITSLQLVQMIIGCAVNYIAFSYKQNGKITIELEGKRKDRDKELELVDIWYLYLNDILGMQCGVSDTNLKLSLLMYCSYFVLFARWISKNLHNMQCSTHTPIIYNVCICIIYESLFIRSTMYIIYLKDSLLQPQVF